MSRGLTRIFCVDDHATLVEGLKARFALESDLQFVGSLPTAAGLVAEVERSLADVVLMDIDMPGPDPFEATKELYRHDQHIRTIILSAFVRDHYIDAALNAGAWGYLIKSEPPERIIAGLRKVSAGGFAFSPHVEERMQAVRAAEGSQESTKLGKLSGRELEVLKLIAKGLTRTEIADALKRSPKTIDSHRMSIMEKLDLRDRVDLTLYAIREGLVEP